VYYGWNILDQDSWIHEQGDQARSNLFNEKNYPGYSQQAPTLVGSHNHVLVADGDGYDDYVSLGTTKMTTFFKTPSVSLAGLSPNSLTLEFDSSYRPESGTQEGTADVSYDGGTTWHNLLDYTNANTGGVGSLQQSNTHLTLDANNPAGATTAMFRFGYLNAGNEWWWAIDNIKVTGATPNAGATLTAALGTQAAHGTVTMSANGAFTYVPNAGYIGTDTFTYTASDGTHVSAPTTDTINVLNAVAGVQVNDGSAQRSEVRSITVNFAGVATFTGDPAAAFQLTQVNGGASVALAASVATNNGLTSVTLMFSGAATDPVSALNGAAPSLADGRYQLTVLASAVTVNGHAFNSGTNYISPTDTLGGGAGQLGLFRLFGDATGNGVVDPADLGQFRSTFNAASGTASYLAYLDADNSGVVGAPDLGQFRNRFNQSVFT
jgi:hypothetical protein